MLCADTSVMNLKQLLALAAGLLVAVALGVFLLLRPSGAEGAALDVREKQLQKLGAALAAARPGCHVLVLSNPFARGSTLPNERSRFENAGVRGLREGLGKKSTVQVVFPEIRPEHFSNPGSIVIPPDSRNPLSFLMQPASVEALARAHPECQVIVTLIGLPVGVDQLSLWDEKDPHAFALLLPDLRLLGPPEKTLEAFRRGKILAAVADVPGSSEPLLITPDNAADILQRHPAALGY